MKYLLDTCLISEATRPQSASGVTDWLTTIDESLTCISAITIGEISKGIAALPAGSKQQQLADWLENDLLLRFHQRIIALDAPLMQTWGHLRARCEKVGRVLPILDSLIAATALHHNVSIVTRNVADFADTGVTILNPWVSD